MASTKPKIEYLTSFHPRVGSISQWFIPFGPKDRKAKCFQCSLESLTDERLPFFKTNPKKDHDEYYCGCRGWD